MAVEVGRWYEVLDPSWVDTKGRKSVQHGIAKGNIVEVLDIDNDGDAEVVVVIGDREYNKLRGIIAPQHLKELRPPVSPPPPEPDGYGTIPLF